MSAIDTPFDEGNTLNKSLHLPEGTVYHQGKSIGSLWPLGVYFGACLVLAANEASIIQFMDSVVGPWLRSRNQAFAGTQFGQVMGLTCVLAIIAGLCGHNAVRSLGIASLLAVAFFVSITLFHWSPHDNVDHLFYSYNLPLMIFGAALPLLLARLFTGRILSRNTQIFSGRRFRIDRLLQLTAVIACLIFFSRVPMQANQLSYATVAVYLPGLVILSTLATTIAVLPSVNWGFKQNVTWKSWLSIAVTSSLGVILLCAACSFILGDWLIGLSFGPAGTMIAVLFFLTLYISGIAALRLSGFRWAKPTATATATAGTTAGSVAQDRPDRSSTGWLWMVGFLLVALGTNVPLRLQEWYKRVQFDYGMRWINEIRADGGDASWVGQGISLVTIPPQNSGYWLERLNELPVLHSVSLVGTEFGDREIEALISSKPTIGVIDLDGTKITDQTLKHLAGARNLRAINLSRTDLSAAAVAEYVSSLNIKGIVLTLEDMGLSDEDFVKIYSPKVWGWGLAGNRLTEASLLQLFRTGGDQLDISRNSGCESIFSNSSIQVTPNWIKLNEVEIGDAEVATWIANAPPQSVTLGKTSISLSGLENLLKTCQSINFLEGSFDEDSLAQLSPRVVPQSISFQGKSFTGDFLSHWPELPVFLNVSHSSFSDAQLAQLADRSDWNPVHLVMKECNITDASLPILEKFQLKGVALSNTQVSAEGLYKTLLPGARIWLDPHQFSYDEIERLKERHSVVVTSHGP